MNASGIVMLLGWFFLILNFVWPSTKWGGHTTKIVFSSISVGLFLANAIYAFIK